MTNFAVVLKHILEVPLSSGGGGGGGNCLFCDLDHSGFQPFNYNNAKTFPEKGLL